MQEAIRAIESNDIAYIEDNLIQYYHLDSVYNIMNDDEFLLKIINLKRLEILKLVSSKVCNRVIDFIIECNWFEAFKYYVDKDIYPNIDLLIYNDASKSFVELVNKRCGHNMSILNLVSSKYIDVIECDQIIYGACLCCDLSLFEYAYKKFGNTIYLDLKKIWESNLKYGYIIDLLSTMTLEKVHSIHIKSLATKCYESKLYKQYVDSILWIPLVEHYDEDKASTIRSHSYEIYCSYLRNNFINLRYQTLNYKEYSKLVSVASLDKIRLRQDRLILTKYLYGTYTPDIEVVKYILNTYDIDINLQEGVLDSAMHIMASKSNVDIKPFINLFINKGAHLDYKSKLDRFPMHLTSNINNASILNPRRSPLKCLCAQKIVNFNISTKSLPISLVIFVNAHKFYQYGDE